MVESYETVIVGAGLSGLAVATGLARRGVGRVAVVDAGGIGTARLRGITAGARVPQTVFDADRDADLPRWCPWISESAPHYAEPIGLRRRVGGRSLCWHGVVLRMHPWECGDSTPWPPAVTRELLGSGHGGLYREVERELRDWAGGPLDRTRTASESYLHEWVTALGYGGVRPAPLAARHVDGQHVGDLPAYSPLHAWTEELARGHPLPDVLAEREVVAVRLARGQVVGLDVRHRHGGSAEFVPGERVVLAAGTIENTRLVAQAIGLTGGSVPTFEGLNDHIIQGFAVTIPVSTWGFAHHRDGGCLVLRGDGSTRFNLFFKLRGTQSSDHLTLDVWTMGEQERADRNRISFTDTTSFPWTTLISTGLSANDRQLIRAEQDALQGVWLRTAKVLNIPDTPLQFADFFRNSQPIGTAYGIAASQPGQPVPFSAALGTSDHEAGSLPLGSVVDIAGQVPGCAGLYVTGPAVFPKSGAVNPSLTTLALARRLATKLATR